MMRGAGYSRPQSLPLLDIYSGAAAAYSLRKLRTAYAGSAIRVRRSSDSTEQDIGFSGNDLDTTALLSFCGAGDGFVTTWYDQSGNARNLAQATATNQPKIVSSGVVEDGILFDGTNDQIFRTGSTAFASNPMTVVARVQTISRVLYNVLYNFSSSINWVDGYGFYVHNSTQVRSWNSAYNNDTFGTLVNMSSSWSNAGQVFSGTSMTTYVNGSLLATDTIGANYASVVGASTLRIGNDGGGTPANMRIKHFIFFANDQTSNMATLNGLLT